MKRCEWANRSELEQSYHDKEWGTPIHDDRSLFEFVVLEGAQAGLSWSTILRKREGYRKAFDNFDARKISRYSEKDVSRLLADSGIIRNRLKINGTITNARAFLQVQEEYGGFAPYLWRFVNGRPIQNSWKKMTDIPTFTPESETMSRELQKRGFKFVGSTICYALMQAVGMVNDHVVDCFRYAELKDLKGLGGGRPGQQVEMARTFSNLVLIGMPGSGKSTVGVILAKKISRDFVDTDLLIQKSQERKLQDIVDNDGYAALRHIEESVLLDLCVRNHVIATGGSAVYSDQAMAHLKSDGLIIFLDVDLEMLESRIPDFSTRGIARGPEQSFSELFEERIDLYAKYADITIKCGGLTQEDVCARIVKEAGS